MMLQQEKPEDFVIATGKQYPERDFVNDAQKILNMIIEWKGKELVEKVFNVKNIIRRVIKRNGRGRSEIS